MQLVDVIRSLRRHWRVSVAILLLCGIALGLFVFTRAAVRGGDRWMTSVQVLVPARDKDGVLPEGVPPGLLQGQAAVALSQDTTGAALVGVGLDDASRPDVEFSVEANQAGDILTLSVTAADRDLSKRLADSYANAYTAARRAAVAAGEEAARDGARQSLVALQARLEQVESELRATDPLLLTLLDSAEPVDGADPTSTPGEEDRAPTLDLPAGTPLDTVLRVYERRTLIDRIASTQQAYARSSTASIVPQSFATVVERMVPQQTTPDVPSPLIPAAVALAVGLLLATGAPVLLDRLDHSIRDPRAVSAALSAPVLSTIPMVAGAELTALARPGTRSDSAYRTLAAASIATDQLPRSIVVTSPVGEMQDTVAANFAAALAGLGLRVALVATDPRQAWFTDSALSEGAPTLGDLLTLAQAGRLNSHIRDSLVPTHIENLAVLAPGATRADALLDGLPPLLHALADSDVDVTVIAGPAQLEGPVATILAWSTRSVLWVVEAGRVTEQQAREAASRLALTGASAFGVALVDGKG